VALPLATAASPTPGELAEARQWAAARFEGRRETAATNPFFSFTYDGKPSTELLGTWKLERVTRQLDQQRTQRTLTYTDPKTGLEVRCAAVEFHDFPVVEWTLFFKNTSYKDTPILSEILAEDVQLNRGAGAEFVLNHNKGDCNADGFNFPPLRTVLDPGKEVQLKAASGLPTQGSMPYFNIEWERRGVISVLGWPGQWSARFTRDRAAGLRVRAGQEFTHFKLHPGEEVRSPRVVLLFWEGDAVRGQNLWRRWMIAHNMPRPGGKPLKPVLSACNSVLLNYTGMTEQNQLQFIDRYLEEKIPIERWWVDAGWYQVPKGASCWTYGTWEVEKSRFPNGLKPVMDYAHSKGLDTMLWFCPEPVRQGLISRRNTQTGCLAGAC